MFVVFRLIHARALYVTTIHIIRFCLMLGGGIDSDGCPSIHYVFSGDNESIVLTREIHRNPRWVLYDADWAGGGGKEGLLLAMVFTKLELEQTGLVNIRNKFENFQKLHQLIGDAILPAVSLLPNFSDTAAVVFYSGPDDKNAKPTYNTLLSYSPLNNLDEYLSAALQVLHLVWRIHKLGMLGTTISANGLVVRVEHGAKYDSLFHPVFFFSLW
jgi:hypothetical protein